MKVSEVMTQLDQLSRDNADACDRLEAAAAERGADEFAHAALARMRGRRPAAYTPSPGRSIRMSAAFASVAMADDQDFDATVEGLATLPVVTAKAILSAAGLMPEVGDEEHAAHDRRSVATDPVLAGIVSYLRALSPEKRTQFMYELAQKWDTAQAAMIAASRTETAAGGIFG